MAGGPSSRGSSFSLPPHTTLSAAQSFWQRRDESVWRNDDDSKTGRTARTRRAPAAIILTCLRPAIRKIGSKITFFRNLLVEPQAAAHDEERGEAQQRGGDQIIARRQLPAGGIDEPVHRQRGEAAE